MRTQRLASVRFKNSLYRLWTVLTVQTHQHRVSLQLGDVDRVHLLITCRTGKQNSDDPTQHV